MIVPMSSTKVTCNHILHQLKFPNSVQGQHHIGYIKATPWKLYRKDNLTISIYNAIAVHRVSFVSFFPYKETGGAGSMIVKCIINIRKGDSVFKPAYQ